MLHRLYITAVLFVSFQGFSGFMDSDGPYEAIVDNGELSSFDTDTLRRVTQFKWQAYGLPIYNFLAFLHFFITASFTLGQVSTAVFPDWSGMRAGGVYWVVIHLVVGICVIPFLFFEGREASREGFCIYVKDLSNYLEVGNCIGVMSPIPYFYIVQKPMPKIVTSFLILTTWLRVLTYLRAYQLTGSLMRMITAIVLKMRVFMMIMLILGIGYMAAFTVLFPNLLMFRGARMRIFITFFEAMLGEPMMMGMFNDPATGELEDMNMTTMSFLEQQGDWIDDPFLTR